jgi:glutamate dehydrogenase
VGDVARAYIAVLELFRLREIWEQIEELDHKVPMGVQMEMMLQLIGLVKRATRWVLRNRRHRLCPAELIAEFDPGMDQLFDVPSEVFRGTAAEQFQSLYEHYLQAGVGAQLAETVARTSQAYTALGIINVGLETEVPLPEVARFYFAVGERLELDWFVAQILATKVESEWQALARDTYLEDLEWQHRTLTMGALAHRREDGDLMAGIDAWEEQEAMLLRRWREMLAELHATETPDFAMFAVANRELLDLAQSSTRNAEAV